MAKSPHNVTVVCVLESHKDLAEWNNHKERFRLPPGWDILWVRNGFKAAGKDQLPGRTLEFQEHRSGSEAINLGIDAVETPLVFVSRKPVINISCPTKIIEELNSQPQFSVFSPLVNANGQIASTGGYVDSDYSLLPLAAGIAVNEFNSDDRTTIDFASSLGMLFRREDFVAVGGLGDSFNSQIYSDAEFCARIMANFGAIVFDKSFSVEIVALPQSEILRENSPASNSDARVFSGILQSDLARGSVQRSRPALTESVKTLTGLVTEMYTPFPLHTGGGERYLLTALETAASLGADATLITEREYSNCLVERTVESLGLPKATFARLGLNSNALSIEPADLFMPMGNSLYPPIAGRGKVNLYHCQFPFTTHHNEESPASFEGYSGIIVNSQYTKAAIEAKVGDEAPPIHVLYPPVPGYRSRSITQKEFSILSVGRFFVGDHTKNQHLLIQAFRELFLQDNRWQLNLVGGIAAGGVNKAYADECVAAAEGLPIVFHFDAPLTTYQNLLGESSVYWHGTGLGIDVAKNPEQAEHFGISIAEAMSAGLVPFVVSNGGPVEYVSDGVNGFTYSTSSELVTKTLDFSMKPRPQRAKLSRQATVTAGKFGESEFTAVLSKIFLDSLNSTKINS